jgi:hypothetical protein
MIICKDSPEGGEHTMNFGLNDRVALVAGTSKGIGTTTRKALLPKVPGLQDGAP